jgi:hypothetical protein
LSPDKRQSDAKSRSGDHASGGSRSLLLVIVAIGGFAVGYVLFGPSAPFGTRLPSVKPTIRYAGVSVSDTSLLKGQANDAWIPNVAPQEDGAPPLVWSYASERGDFKIGVPYGTEMVSYSNEEFLKDSVDAQGTVKLDQALRAIKVSMPGRNKDETIETYASRIRNDIERAGGTFYNNQDPVNLPAFRFVRLEYHRVHDGADVAHHLFLGPMGKRVLIIDLMSEPKHRELVRPYVEKMIRSFTPGWTCKRGMLMEDASYGQYAGSNLLNEPNPLRESN